MAPTLKHSRFSRAAYDPWFQHIKPPDNYSLPSVTAYHILSMFGFATCLLFTGTILFSRRVQRHKSVPNFFGFLAFSAFMHNLTWFTGHVNIFQTKNPPPFALCYFQSSMIAGLSTGQGLAAVFLVFQVWLAISRTYFSSKSASYFDFMERPLCQWTFFAAPWAVWLIYAIANAIVGGLDPSSIRANSLYCATTDKEL
ncbi:hypothetical protein NCC49_000995 [Naganishia albida]|nr:hypothetical protein NCC49_000995 [Naganishia albida]